MNLNFAPIGKILKTKGFDGTTIVSFDYEVIQDNFKAFFIQKGSQYTPLLIDRRESVDATTYHIVWKNYNNKELAVSLNNTPLFIQENNVEQFFDIENDDDIIGYRVVNSDEPLGEVIELYDNGQQETIEVALNNGKKLLIPLVEEYIEWIDDESEIIVAKLSSEFIEMFSVS